MNWQSVAFDWNQARAFLATVEEGSLSAAARALGLTQPTLGRQVTALEAELGVVLFERVGRSLVLTPSGVELLEHVRAMYAAANQLSLTASGQSQSIEGLVRVTATDILSVHVLPPAVVTLRKIAPRLDIQIIAANDIRDLQRREADIAIRHVRPEQPDLIARLVCEPTAHAYASKSYIEKYGRPKSLAELSTHSFIGDVGDGRVLEALKEFGLDLSPENFRVGANSGVVEWEMAQNGLGVAIMADRIAAAAPQMKRLLPDMKPIVFPVWLASHRELHTSRRIRVVFDLLAKFLVEEMMEGKADV